MAFSLGDAILTISGKADGLNRALGDAERFTQRAVGNIQNSMRRVGTAMSVVGGAMTVASAGVLKFAMDAQESENLFEVSMGNMAEAARAWSEETGKALGLNRFEIRKNLGTIFLMSKNMGIAEDQAYEMATSLTSLAYDIASFRNLRPEDAFLKIQSALSGEVEPMKRLGIVINETAVKTYAMANGIGLVEKAGGKAALTTEQMTTKARDLNDQLRLENINYQQKIVALQRSKKSGQEYKLALEEIQIQHRRNITSIQERQQKLMDSTEAEKEYKVELTEAQKVMIRYQLLIQQTTQDQGDLLRTQDSATNVQRRLRSQMEEQAALIGTALIPAYTEFLKRILPIVQKIGEWAQANPDLIVQLAQLGVALAIGGPLMHGMAGFLGFGARVVTMVKSLTAALGGAGAVAGFAVGASLFVALTGLAALLESFRNETGFDNFLTRMIDEHLPSFGRAIDAVFNKIVALLNKMQEFADDPPWWAWAIPGINAGLGLRKLSGLGAPPRDFLGPGAIAGLATGTAAAPRGLAMVGERGRELVNFGGGERVFNNGDTNRLLAALAGLKGGMGGGGITIQNMTVVANDPDAFKRAMNHQLRMTGVFAR